MEERGLNRQQTTIEEKDKRGVTLNKYIKGRYLGKGGFAKCYQFTHIGTGRKFAAKIIEKATLTRSKAKEKLASQIEIHKSVKSQFVVKYQKHFEDAANVYILLELCTNQTMNELIKRRKRITQIEARYYLKQIALAMKDFQEQLIIHRDLKLGNLLLTDALQIRISDFGLAAKLNHRGQRRKTMCGTPNYIAPEILENHTNGGHSYEVDIWSLGVIAYACLVGRPPFETNDVKTTYAKIKMCNYSFPENITLSTVAKHFISKLLQKDPRHRLTVEEVLNDQFFALPIPEALPTTLLACPPNKAFIERFHVSSNPELRHRQSTESTCQRTDRYLEKGESVRTLVRTNSIEQLSKNNYGQRAASTAALTRGRMLSSRTELQRVHQPAAPTTSAPYIWITFYEENPKFGIAYLLNSGATGMRFNDSTTIISNHQFQKMKYRDFMSSVVEEVQFDASSIPTNLNKKYKIISYYQKELKNKKDQYDSGLNNQQIIMRERQRFKESTQNAMTVWVTKSLKTSKATVFWFNTKDYQTIFQDFTQLLFSKDNITYVNKLGQRIYFKKDNIDSQIDEIKKRYKYTLNIIQTFKDSRNRDTIRERESRQNRQNRQSRENRENIDSRQNRQLREIRDNREKENKPETKTTMIRSSSVMKIEKTQPVILRGSASTSRINGGKVMRY